MVQGKLRLRVCFVAVGFWVVLEVRVAGRDWVCFAVAWGSGGEMSNGYDSRR